MINIFTLQWQRLRRQPSMALAMVAMTVIFIFVMAGTGMGDRTIYVPIHFSDEVGEHQQTHITERLNDIEGFVFEETDVEEMEELVALGNVTFGVKLAEDHYTFVVSTLDHNKNLADNHLRSVYQEYLRIEAATAQTGTEKTREVIESSLEQPPIRIKSEVSETEEEFFIYNNQLQVLFGMTLFFVIYTVIFSLGEIVEEKQRGSWDRIILSPIRKWQVYVGYLCYAFIIGMLQIVFVFSMFEFLFDIQLRDYWFEILLTSSLYVFSIVALGILLAGLVKKGSQLSAVVPIISVSMAMLGGAYWPSEAVSNNIILSIAKVIPVTHAMDALKSIAVYGNNLADIAQSLSVLLLMGVLFMGIGINLMERRG